MKKISKLINQVAELKGLYVQECNDSFNLNKNYIIGRLGENSVEYFKTIKDVEYYLGIREDRDVVRNGIEYIEEIKYNFNEVKKTYQQELNCN